MNPYSKTIIDEASGIEIKNDLYEAYQEGTKEVIDWVNANSCWYEGASPLSKWEVKQKEWEV